METFYFLEKALLSLTKEEHKRFEKFLHADYFKKKHSRFHDVFISYKLIKINILRPHNKSFNDSECDKIIKNIYANKKNDAAFCKKYLNLLKSDLLSYLMDFIVIESFLKDNVFYEISILNELKKRNLTDIFDHYCKADRFKELNTNYNEHEASYFYWKLFQTVNKHREMKRTDSEKIDYSIEKNLLGKYIKYEFSEHYKRMQSNTKNFIN